MPCSTQIRLERVSPAFGLVCRGDGGEDRDLVPPPGRTWSEDRAGGLGAQALIPGVGVLQWRASRLLAGEPVRVTMYYEAFAPSADEATPWPRVVTGNHRSRKLTNQEAREDRSRHGDLNHD